MGKKQKKNQENAFAHISESVRNSTERAIESNSRY